MLALIKEKFTEDNTSNLKKRIIFSVSFIIMAIVEFLLLYYTYFIKGIEFKNPEKIWNFMAFFSIYTGLMTAIAFIVLISFFKWLKCKSLYMILVGSYMLMAVYGITMKKSPAYDFSEVIIHNLIGIIIIVFWAWAILKANKKFYKNS